MALKMNTMFHGIHVPDAYCVVGSLVFPGDSKTVISFALSYRANPEVNIGFLDEYFVAPYSLEGGDPYTQAYEYLKTLPEFTDSTDC